jgi:hypothetical protein
VLLDQCLLNLYLLPKYYKLFVYGRAGELASHHFEDGLEFISQLRLLHEGIDDPEVDAVREAVDALADVHGEELVPHGLLFLRVLRYLLHELQSLLDFLQPLFLLQPRSHHSFAILLLRLGLGLVSGTCFSQTRSFPKVSAECPRGPLLIL